MAKRKPRHKSITNSPLSKEVASKVVEIISRGEPLFSKESYAKNEPREIPIKDGVYLLKPENYRYYMKSRLKPEGSSITFYQQVQEARFMSRMKKHEETQKEMVLEAQNALRTLSKLPLGTKTQRVLKKYRMIKDSGKVQTHEEVEVIDTPIDPRMVVAKQKGSEFILERLDPTYKKDNGGNTVNVMVNLGELRRAKEERTPKPLPKEDYEVKQ